jgi:acetylornithine deacetylase
VPFVFFVVSSFPGAGKAWVLDRALAMIDLFALTRCLVDIPSVTGDEGAIGKFLGQLLEGLYYKVELQPLSAGRANVLATSAGANAQAPLFVFTTHLDTVPPFMGSSEDGDCIHGRGACDAKGIMAAQIAAGERLRREGMQNVGLLFVADEEAGSLGARLANGHPMANRCGYLINGEPTDNRLAIGSKGSLRVRLQAIGKSAHSAYPEQGESAIEKLLDVLGSLRTTRWPNDAFFGETTCNIGVISGGTAPNVIPAQAHADLQVRLVTPSSELKAPLEKAVGNRAAIEYLSVAEPVKLTQAPGFETCVVRFTTDIPHLNRWGKPLLMGPGSILAAHTVNEHIMKKDLVQAVDCYVRLVWALHNRPDLGRQL